MNDNKIAKAKLYCLRLDEIQNIPMNKLHYAAALDIRNPFVIPFHTILTPAVIYPNSISFLCKQKQI